jgi:fermentation-respiration switch protein FrsA (DUF1100 family)
VTLGLAILGLTLLAGGLICYCPYYCYRVLIRRKRPLAKPGKWTDPEPWIDRQDYEEVSIRSGDGLNLNAYYIAAPGGAANGDTVILAHGYMGDGKQLSEFARIFWEKLGCHVLLPEARGYGRSGGHYTGFGWHDRLDILEWIGWVNARGGASAGTGGPPPVRIVLFGVSMGAATVLMVSGESLPPEVKLIIADCGYTSLEDEVRYQLKHFYHLPGFAREPLLKAASALTQKRAGYSFAEASALDQVKKSRTATLFIHGDADAYVPTAMVYPLFEACPAEKELYIVKGAGHGEARSADPEGYEKRIAGFIGKYMPSTERL